jgi:hypothetical protein
MHLRAVEIANGQSPFHCRSNHRADSMFFDGIISMRRTCISNKKMKSPVQCDVNLVHSDEEREKHSIVAILASDYEDISEVIEHAVLQFRKLYGEQ